MSLSASSTGGKHLRGAGALPVVAAMLLYSVTLYGGSAEGTSLLVAVVAAPVIYVLAMYLIYGIARLTYQRQTLWLWGGAMGAVGLSMVLTDGTQLPVILAGWGVILSAGVVSGQLTIRGVRPRMVVTSTLIVMSVFAIAQFYMLWQEVLGTSQETIATLVEEARRQLSVIGESPERIREGLESFELMMSIAMRLVPAEMLLGTAAQFTVGYLLFLRWIEKNRLAPPQIEPFRFWKIPFLLMPAVLLFAVLRLLGGDGLSIVADNGLAVLAVLYSVAGLALVEYYLRKMQLSTFMRVLFYVMLFLLPLVSLTGSLVLGVAIALGGFVDSFADWRKIRLRELM
ncbi:MAG: YybS family protein [candidate division Zixibacteria bacterium]|nr:YybS family protein [candidate division Zixibacteria bacterium]